jgi:hypothetical protein
MGAAPWVSFLAITMASPLVAAQGFPAFPDFCPQNQIDRPCITHLGMSGTCVPAECRQTVDPQMDAAVDVITTVSCTACAYCVPQAPFPRCTDTIPCEPGYSCFNYGVGPFAAMGPPDNAIQFEVQGSSALCLEGGAGPEVTSRWTPCNTGGGATAPPGSGSGVSPPSGAAGSSGGASAIGSGATSSGGGFGGAIVDGGAPDTGGPGVAGNRETLVAGPSACEIGAAGAASSGLPLLGVVSLSIARRRRTRT